MNMASELTGMRKNEMKKSLNRVNSETDNRKMILIQITHLKKYKNLRFNILVECIA